MFFTGSSCPCCGTQPVAFRSNGQMVILCCWECAACFPSPKEINKDHMAYPDKDGKVSFNGVSFCVWKEFSHDATMKDIEAVGWKSAVAGEWSP
jgi:hypothetical protein